MRLYGPRGHYFEIHVSKNSRKEDIWIMVNYQVRNDFYEWTCNDAEDITYPEMLGLIDRFRFTACSTEKDISKKIDYYYHNYCKNALSEYERAIIENTEIMNLYTLKDFTMASFKQFTEPEFNIYCVAKNADNCLYRVFFKGAKIEPKRYVDCIVDFYATDDELRQLAFELEMELLELPHLKGW